jgi:superfamily II DNA or RNA helicase
MSSSSVRSGLLNRHVSLHLRQHQKRVIRRMLDPRSNHRLLFVAGTGSGKTIAAILTALEMLDQQLIDGVHVVVPTGVVQQFADEIDRLVRSDIRALFGVHTHQTYFGADSASDATHKLLIIDEAHQFATAVEHAPNGNGSGIKHGVYAHMAIQKSRAATGLLLLTATPLQNNPTELFNLFCMVGNSDQQQFYTQMAPFRKMLLSQSKDYIRTGFKNAVHAANGRIGIYAQLVAPMVMFARVSHEGYPAKSERVVRLTMDAAYLKIYTSVENAQLLALGRKRKAELLFDPESEDAFYINLRRVVNGYTENIHSKKISYALDIIGASHRAGQRVLAYSNFINGGVSLMKRALVAKGIPFAEYTGKSTKKHRQWCMTQINQGRVNVLLLSRAGAEGLDLRCIRHVILVEPHFHSERLQQVIGRAVRYRSHDSLPPDQRTVSVHHLLLCKPAATDGLTWEDAHTHNAKQVVRLIRKYEATADTHRVVLHLNELNVLLVHDVFASMQVAPELFELVKDVDDSDTNIYVKVLGGVAFLLRDDPDEYDDVVPIVPAAPNLSVDEILHKMSTRKHYVNQQHLCLLRRQNRKLMLYSQSHGSSETDTALTTAAAATAAVASRTAKKPTPPTARATRKERLPWERR